MAPPLGAIVRVQQLHDATNWIRRSEPGRWFFAVLAFILSFGLRYWLNDQLPPGFPYLTFFPAVIVTTFVAGFAPGLLVGLLGGIASWYFFIPPFNSFALTGASVLALGFYVVIVLVDILLIHGMHVAVEGLRGEQQRSQQHAEQRDTLFKEMQHRVSNNLSVVGSLLNAQRRALPEGDAATALSQAASRVSLVAKMQRELYDPSRQTLDFAAYLRSLGPDLLEAMDAKTIRYEAKTEPVDVSSDVAVPLGLIASECISNSIEHGFTTGGAGEPRILVTLEVVEDEKAKSGRSLVLTISDNGVGWPDGFVPDASNSLGMRIVLSLTQQIGGTFAYRNDGGAVSTLRLDLSKVAGEAPKSS
jgi:two-component sensor histidine kinase